MTGLFEKDLTIPQMYRGWQLTPSGHNLICRFYGARNPDIAASNYEDFNAHSHIDAARHIDACSKVI